MSDADYLNSLVRCYEDEIINEARFLAVARRLPGAAQREKLALLAQVESQAAAALRPILAGHGLVPRDVPALHALGAADPGPDALDWDELMQEIVTEYPRYVLEFRALTRIAPAGDRAGLERLTEHEVATVEFARRELLRDPDSLDPIRSYLGR